MLDDIYEQFCVMLLQDKKLEEAEKCRLLENDSE